MLKIVGQDDRNVYWQLNARSQMPDAIFDAIIDAGEIVVGGRLTVTFAELRGKTKIYEAAYQPPSLGASDSEALFS